MFKGLSILSVLVLAGCAGSITHTHYSKDVELHVRQEMPLGNQTVEVVDVAEDGTTTLELVESGERLTAKVGDYFVSEAFGNHGLQLLSATPGSDIVTVRQRWAGIR